MSVNIISQSNTLLCLTVQYQSDCPKNKQFFIAIIAKQIIYQYPNVFEFESYTNSNKPKRIIIQKHIVTLQEQSQSQNPV